MTTNTLNHWVGCLPSNEASRAGIARAHTENLSKTVL
jgi:hypothetical protein